LDFESYPEWSKAFFSHIKVTKGDPNDLKPKDELSVGIPSATFKPVVLVSSAFAYPPLPSDLPLTISPTRNLKQKNEPTVLIWRGSLPYIFSGDHSFEFQPSSTTPGGTTFINKEVFTGLLSFVMGLMGDGTSKGFEGFNRDLKARAEELYGQ